MFNFDREEITNKERIRRLASWHNGKKEGPFQIDIELHKRCNLKCIFCVRYDEHEKLNKESKKNEMVTDRWLEIIDEAADLKALVFNIEGINEPPFVPKIFFPVINKVKESGLYGIVTTNGTIWNEDQIKNLVEISWDRIHFSIHSHNQEIHDCLTGMKGSFNKAVKNIRLLNEWKKKMDSDRPMLNMNICINKLNFRQLPDIVKLAHSLNVAYIFTEPLMVYTKEGGKFKLNEEESHDLFAVVGRAKELAEEYEIDNNFATQDKNLEKSIVGKTRDMKNLLLEGLEKLPHGLVSSPCFKPWDIIAIRYNGLTGHCGFVEEGENVKKRSLKEIWYGEYFENVRKKMLKGELLPHCHKCVPSDMTQRKRFRRELIELINSGS